MHMIQLLQNKLSKFVPIFRELRNYLSIDNLLKIYHTNVNSLISYCSMIYLSGNSSMVHKIERMQYRILKVIFGVRSCDVDTCMKKHKILNVINSNKIKLLSIGHKMKYDKLNLPVFFQNFYKNKILATVIKRLKFEVFF